jgi:hypothetical protein
VLALVRREGRLSAAKLAVVTRKSWAMSRLRKRPLPRRPGRRKRRSVIVASCAARTQRSRLRLRCRAVPDAARIGGGFSSGGGSLTGGGLGGSSGCGGFGGSSMGGGGSFIGDGPLGALSFFETTNKVSPFTTGLFWPFALNAMHAVDACS